MTDRYIDEEEALRRARIAKRRARMRREKERQRLLRMKIRLYTGLLAGCVILAVIILLVKSLVPQTPEKDAKEGTPYQGTVEGAGVMPSQEGENSKEDLQIVPQTVSAGELNGTEEPVETVPASVTPNGKVMVGDKEFWFGYEAEVTTNTSAIYNEEVASSYAILIDASTGEIVVNRDAMTRINPASMTKVLTVLVAAQQLENLDEEVTITFEMTDYAYVNDCSVVGFEVGEKVPVKDLLYGTILPSGGEAAIALATHVAGSQEAFMDLMNKKLEELGLSDTAHFTNCVGLFDENHYCTAYDMAIIMKAALENDICREVLAAKTYQTTLTPEHPEGLLVSNWFLRRIEDKDCGGEVLGAKTGYVNESGSCAVSYAVSQSGTPYICVTANAHSSWRCIYDHVAIYSTYGK